MTFTSEQLTQAVREVGRDGKPFSSAAVRKVLGMTTRDKRALTRFNNQFREFQKAFPNELEKLANNRYRLCNAVAETAPLAPEAAVPSVIEAAVPSVIEAAVPSEIEAAVPSEIEAAPSEIDVPRVAALAVVELGEPSRAQTRVEIHDATPPGEREGSAVEVQLASDDADRPAMERLRPVLRRALVRGYRLGAHVAAHVSRASALLRSRRGQAAASPAPIDATGS